MIYLSVSGTVISSFREGFIFANRKVKIKSVHENMETKVDITWFP